MSAALDPLSGWHRSAQLALQLAPPGRGRSPHAFLERAPAADLVGLDQTGVRELADVVERRARRHADELAQLARGRWRALEQHERLEADRMAHGGEEEGLFEHAQETRPYGLRPSNATDLS
jgi:hypothetical protein